METHVEIGKSILNKYSEYAEEEVIDDEAEFFPTVKVIIDGIVGTLESSMEKEKVESILIDHVKQHYVSLWLKHATEDEENPDFDYEKRRASSEFDRMYYD
jgi:hypothetical protein